MNRLYEVEVTKTETRTYKTTVAVESDLRHDTGELDEFEAAWEDDVREKAVSTALMLGDEEWELTIDERADNEKYDTGEIEDVADGEVENASI